MRVWWKVNWELASNCVFSIISPYRKHQHKVSPSYTIHFVDLIYFIVIQCRMTPVRQSRVYIQPWTKQIPCTVITTTDTAHSILQTLFYHHYHHLMSTISMRELVSRRVDHTGSQQFMNPMQITPHQLLAMKRSTTEQDCIYCIIFQIKLHICYMLGRLVHKVHNVFLSILDTPLFNNW